MPHTPLHRASRVSRAGRRLRAETSWGQRLGQVAVDSIAGPICETATARPMPRTQPASLATFDAAPAKAARRHGIEARCFGSGAQVVP